MADLSATCDSIHLVIATSQTFSASQRDLVVARINRSLLHINDSLKSVKEDLNCCLRRQSRDSWAPDQEYSLASKQENKYEFEILINSSVKTFRHSLRNLIHSAGKVKYLVLSTLDFNTNGDLLFQDAAFSLEDFLLALGEEKKETETKLVLLFSARFAEANKHWRAGLDKSQHKGVTTALVGEEANGGSGEYDSFLNDLKKYLNEAPVESFMDVSKFTGTLRINRPCLYIFPGKEGDAAYFTINGYSMLINGGYDRLRPCFWRFVNMLQQIDSVLVTHTDADALGGLGSFFAKKLASPDIKPNILSVLGNLIGSSTNKAAHTAASLIASEAAAAQTTTTTGSGARSDVDTVLEAIEKLQIKLVPLVKSSENLVTSKLAAAGGSKYEHINLYSKLGHGSFDLYVLSPFANSKEFKDFVQQQLTNVEKHVAQNKSHLSYKSLFKTIPLSHLNSAVVLAVWLPSYSPAATGNENNALRLLFTGNAPQSVILSALDKLKDFDILQHPTYKVKAAASVTHNETLVHNLVAGLKKAASKPAAAPAPAKEAHASNAAASSSPSTEASNKTSAAPPKPVHTKPAVAKDAKDATSNQAAKPADKPPAAPKPAPKPAKEAPAKEAAPAHKPSRASHEPKAPAKPKETKEGEEAKEEAKKDEVKKPVPKVAAKPAPAPAKPKEAAKANGTTEANGHVAKDSTKPAAHPATNGVTKSAEKPKPAPKPAAKPAPPKEQANTSVASSSKKPAAGGKTEAAAPAKKEKDEASRIITKRNVPKKSVDPVAKPEEAAATTAAAAVAAVVAEEPVKTEAAAPVVVEGVPVANGHVTEAVVSQDQIVSHQEPVAAEPEQPEVVQEAEAQNESVVQEPEQNESLVESVQEAAEELVSPREVEAEVTSSQTTEETAEPQTAVVNQSSDLYAQFDNLKIESQEAVEPAKEEEEVTETDEVVAEVVNGNGVHSEDFHQNGNGFDEATELKQQHNGNGLIDFDTDSTPGFGGKANGGKGVVENLISIEGESQQSYEKSETETDTAHHVAGYETDPAKWNLLELPKPVTPDDSSAPVESAVAGADAATDSANTSLAEKKKAATNGGKKTSLAPESKDKAAPAGAKTTPAAPKTQQPAKPVKAANVHPAYVEVTYIPAHGNSFYVDSEYFRRVRARFYVLSTQEPSEALLNALIEGKESWEDKSLQLSLIPTYESESLRRWFLANEETLARLKIDILPAANLATLTMDDNPDLSFQLYKLEF